MVVGRYDLDSEVGALVADALDLGFGVGGENVDRHYHRQAEEADIFDVLLEVFHTFFDRPDIDFFNSLESDTAVVFERTDRGYQYYHIGFETGLATLDIGEFFRAEVRAETRFGDGVFGEVQG